MHKRILLALDLEGVNNVAGEPYEGLTRDSEQWNVARNQAVLEINAAAEALFDAGAEKVGLWDNHGGGGNVNVADLDSRIIPISADPKLPRMSFIKDEYDCICYFGYHTMEGTLGGVLAHTMNSKVIQHYKLNGKHIGEVNMDAYIAASYGIPSIFFAGGDLTCSQAKNAVPHIVTVVTKKEISRNEAVFRNNEELFADIKANIVMATQKDVAPLKLTFPAIMEKSFKRTEAAAEYFSKMNSSGIDTYYPSDEILGYDAHTVITKLHNISDFIKCI